MQQPLWAAIVVLHEDAGATVELIARRANAAPDAGPSEGFLRTSIGPEGARYLVTPQPNGPFPAVEADGTVRCENAAFEARSWTRAIADGTCRQLATNAGIVQPTQCHDVKGCSAAGAGLSLAWVALLLGRVRRVR